MKILYDIRVLDGDWSGIAVYSYNLIKTILQRNNNNSIYLLSKNNETYDIIKPLIDESYNIQFLFLNYGIYDARNFYYLNKIIKENKIDIYFTTQYFWPFNFLSCFVISMIHDIIPLTHSEYLPYSRKSKMKFLFKLTTFLSLKYSDFIIVNSNNTFLELKKYFGETYISKCRKLFPPIYAKKDNFLNETYDHIINYDRIKKFVKNNSFLYVGRHDPYKNLLTLIHAFNELIKSDYDIHLIIAGKKDERYPEAAILTKNLKLENNIFFTDFIEDFELDYLYKNIEFTINPSIIEGLGLPPLEALVYNKICLVSKIPVFKEVLGKAAIYFDPQEINSIKDTLIKALHLTNEEKQELIELAKEELKKFDPDLIFKEWSNIIGSFT